MPLTHERELACLHLINAMIGYRREARHDFAGGIAFAILALKANQIEPGFEIGLDGLPFSSFDEVRAVIAEFRADAEGDSHEAIALKRIIEDLASGQQIGSVCRYDHGPVIRFSRSPHDNTWTIWRPTEAES